VTTRELGGGLAVVRRCGVPGPQAGDQGAVGAVLARLEVALAHLEAQDERACAEAGDAVTGLGNRARFDTLLERAVIRAARRHEAVAVIVLELRGFEAMAESLGPEVSDLVLRACARVLRSGSYGYAPAFRLEAGEMAVLVPGADVLTALAMAEQMHTELPPAAATVLPPGPVLPVAVGIAVFPDSAPDGAGVLEAARAARATATGDGARDIGVAPFTDALEDVLPSHVGERRRRARLRRVERR
jgi:diguanylate cyclase (GGDEF)-like protein